MPARAVDGNQRWFVLHTMSRQEKVLAENLCGLGISSYLPLQDRVRYHGRRKAVASVPLFPGYVFLWGTHEDAYLADRTRKVANLITVEDQETLEWELTQVHRALSGDVLLAPHRLLKRGVRVLVTSGPFKGLEGVVSSRKRMDRLVIQVRMLGSAVSLEIDASLLMVIE